MLDNETAMTRSRDNTALQHDMAHPAPVQWRLEILEGPNAGANLALAPGPYRLGLEAANDIVLSDPALQPQHLSLTITTAGAAVTSHAAGVDLRRRALAAGATRTLRNGGDIRLGSTLMRLHAPAAPHAGAAALVPALVLAGLTAAGITFAAGAPGARPSAAPAAPPRSRPGPSASSAAAALTRQLRDVGLGGSLTVGNGAGGALLVTGILPPDAAPAWHGVRRWFDAAYGSQAALVEQLGAPGDHDAPPLSIAAVSMAPVPVVIARDGTRFTEGAVLPSGWDVQSITAAAVTLRRHGQVLRITL
jgi:hypothetical protein